MPEAAQPAEPPRGQPAFYARPGGRAAQWWTLLHPPYTVWHLSYVVLGAAAASAPDLAVLALTLLAFALAMGIGAHALDELHGRPLGTGIGDRTLWVVAALSVALAVLLGAALAVRATPLLWPLVVVGPLLVAGYNLELCGGRLHTDTGFAVSWGGFPALTGYVAQGPPWHLVGVVAATLVCVAAVLLSVAQRRLSTPARDLRRRTVAIEGTVRLVGGTSAPLDRSRLLAPLEGTLRALCWAVPVLAFGALAAAVSR